MPRSSTATFCGCIDQDICTWLQYGLDYFCRTLPSDNLSRLPYSKQSAMLSCQLLQAATDLSARRAGCNLGCPVVCLGQHMHAMGAPALSGAVPCCCCCRASRSCCCSGPSFSLSSSVFSADNLMSQCRLPEWGRLQVHLELQGSITCVSMP